MSNQVIAKGAMLQVTIDDHSPVLTNLKMELHITMDRMNNMNMYGASTCWMACEKVIENDTFGESVN